MESNQEKFHKQIEDSINNAGDSLKDFPEKLKALYVLKKRLLSMIAARQRLLLEDLVLKNTELQSIFEELQAADKDIFAKLEISDFSDFEKLFGIPFSIKTEFLDSNGTVDLFGLKINLHIPLGVSKRTMAFYMRIIEKITEYPELKEYIDYESGLVPIGNGRLRFWITKNGKKTEYRASYEKVLRFEENLPYEGGILLDERTGQKVEESVIYDNFSWTFLDENGNPARRTDYQDGIKTTETKFTENGEKTEFVLIYKNEKVSLKTVGNNVYVYDEKGEAPICFLEKTFDGRLLKGEIISENGKEALGDFIVEKNKNPEITESEYLRRFKSIVTNAERYFIFEEVVLDKGQNFSEKLINEIRSYGKEITGTKDLMEKFYEKHGIKIHGEFSREVSTGMVTLKALIEGISQIDYLLEVYPPGFVRRHVHEIYFGAELKAEGTVDIAGAAGIFGLLLELPLKKGALYHEVHHCIDNVRFFDNDNYAWGLGIYGEDYEKQYNSMTMKEFEQIEQSNDDRPEGFPSLYAKLRGMDEDQADIAEALLTGDRSILKASRKEPVLKRKLDIMRKRYLEYSGGKMDLKFWNDLLSGRKIDDEYWRRRGMNPAE